MKSVAARMAKAKMALTAAVAQTMQSNELPAYIMEGIIADVLVGIEQTAKVELMNEMERENVGMEQSIQPDKLEK